MRCGAELDVVWGVGGRLSAAPVHESGMPQAECDSSALKSMFCQFRTSPTCVRPSRFRLLTNRIADLEALDAAPKALVS